MPEWPIGEIVRLKINIRAGWEEGTLLRVTGLDPQDDGEVLVRLELRDKPVPGSPEAIRCGSAGADLWAHHLQPISPLLLLALEAPSSSPE